MRHFCTIESHNTKPSSQFQDNSSRFSVALRGLAGISGVEVCCCELSAGCVYFLASFVADYGFDACVHEDVFEVLDCWAGGGAKGAAFVGVELDEVDGGVYAFDEADERLGVGGGVVEVFYHAVFEADAPMSLLLVCLDCGNEFGEGVLCCDGHDALSSAVGGGMERDGESDL